MSDAAPPSEKHHIAILGAGPGGLCIAIQLRRAGLTDFVVLEKAEGVGGTWYHNRYPGCACDIPSHLYSFSFEIKRDWTRPYAPQPEILAYMEQCAEKYGVLPHCRFGDGVSQATWNEAGAEWQLTLESGRTTRADIVVSAVGMFNEVVWPKIEGIDRFGGTLFHSARWNWDHDLSGETVGVIGTAASAVQFVPEIVKSAGQVHLFQRTANWVLPKEDTPYTPEQIEQLTTDPDAVPAIRDEIFRGVDEGMTFSEPARVDEMEVACRKAMEVVEDEAVRAKLEPTHRYGCKRPLFSNDYYPAFNRENLELVTEGIERISERGIVTDDGQERACDTIIVATGFGATRYLSAIDVRGRGGVHIEDAWKDGAAAYLGITTAGFPNLFMLYGPNTNNGSILSMIEYQADHIVRRIQHMQAEDIAWIDVRPEPMQAYNEQIQQDIGTVDVWNHACNGYYRTPSGRIVTQWPHSMSEFQRRTAVIDDAPFEIAKR